MTDFVINQLSYDLNNQAGLALIGKYLKRININALTIESRDGLFEGNIKVYVHDKEELNELVSRLKSLRGIQTVDRFYPEENMVG